MIRWLLWGLLCMCATQSGAAVVVSIEPVSQNVVLGSQARFDINVSGLDNGVALGTFDLDVGFDAELLSYSSAAFGDQLDLSGLGDIQSATPRGDSVEIFELSLDSISDLNSLQQPAFRLVTLTFDTLAVGDRRAITLSVNALGDASGNAITGSLQNGSISISAIPEPTRWLLLLIGLAALGLMPLWHRLLDKFT